MNSFCRTSIAKEIYGDNNSSELQPSFHLYKLKELAQGNNAVRNLVRSRKGVGESCEGRKN